VTGPAPQRILVATPEVLGARRAGPAVRAWHLAAALAADPVGHTVTLAAVPGAGPVETPGFSTAAADAPTLQRLAAASDVIVTQGDLLTRVPALAARDVVVVADLYDPYQLEALEQTASLEPDHRRRAVWGAGRAIDDLLRRGDLFLCAGGRQRDFWLGALAGAGRINEATHAASPDFGAFLVDVPFGVEDAPPRHTRPALRDVVPGIGSNDVILWWGGGIYAWLDPGSLLDAVARLVGDHPEFRLVFAGSRHPNPQVGETRAARDTRTHADRLGLTGHHVFFLDWVPYDERASYLLEADIVVSTHLDHLEAAFSYRTRILDALWAARPVVATSGDALSDAVTACDAGIVVQPRSVDALVHALAELVEDPHRRAACGVAAGRLGWERRWSLVVSPLVQFCRTPSAAPDRLDPLIGPMLTNAAAQPPRATVSTRLRRLLGRIARQ
jgi:glycosyltransferase involved in cell wall biosynthesis